VDPKERLGINPIPVVRTQNKVVKSIQFLKEFIFQSELDSQ